VYSANVGANVVEVVVVVVDVVEVVVVVIDRLTTWVATTMLPAIATAASTMATGIHLRAPKACPFTTSPVGFGDIVLWTRTAFGANRVSSLPFRLETL
jgi:hypothetical protein